MKIKIRRATLKDVEELVRLDNIVWPDFPARQQMIEQRVKTFPEGQLVAVMNGKIIGAVFTQRIDYKKWDNKDFTWSEITDHGTIRQTHDPKGPVLYGVGLSVLPDYRNKGVAISLMAGIARMAFSRGINSLYLGAPLLEYYKKSNLSPEEYLKKYKDPEIEFYQKRGFQKIKILPNYMEGSHQAINVLMRIEVFSSFNKLPPPLRKILLKGLGKMPTRWLKKMLGG